MERERGGGHIWLALANAPKILDAVMSIAGALRNETAFDKRFRELGVVMVGLVTKSAYEFDHHWNAALLAGVRREQLENLAQFETVAAFDDTGARRAALRQGGDRDRRRQRRDLEYAAAPFRHAAGDGGGADRRVVQLRGAHPAAAQIEHEPDFKRN